MKIETFKDIGGKKFHHLTAILPISQVKSGSLIWLFLCDCGRTVARRADNVTAKSRKHGTDCGCRFGKGPKTGPYCPEQRIVLHGLSQSRYDALLKEQDNVCAICRKNFVKTPCIDHDHECCSGSYSCGRCVRGLLCDRCNTGLSRFDDNPERLVSAADYLERRK